MLISVCVNQPAHGTCIPMLSHVLQTIRFPATIQGKRFCE